MQLYVTYSSPYARIARVVRREKRLEDRVEELTALTRTVNSPYYQINPSGRVPYLFPHFPDETDISCGGNMLLL
jgi:glutathione S-transferase